MYWRKRRFEVVVACLWLSLGGVAGLAACDAGVPGKVVATCEDGTACEAAVARVVQAIRMRAERLHAVPLVVQDLERTLQTVWPGCKALMYGSVVTGLAFQWSDIDVTVQPPNATLEDVATAASPALERRPGLFRVTRTVPNARIPIVEAQHGLTGFIVDVSLQNYDGVFISKLVRHLLSLDDRLLNLALVVKHWAKLQGLTRKGFLPSYGIIAMLIFFLQQKRILPSIASLQENVNAIIVDDWNMVFKEKKYSTTNDEPLCALLGGFFKYYADFDFGKCLVSPYAGRPIDISLFEDLSTVPEEFAVYKNNVASNITTPLRLKVPLVQDIFHHAFNIARRTIFLPISLFVNPFRDAATKFQKNCTNFLEAILST